MKKINLSGFGSADSDMDGFSDSPLSNAYTDVWGSSMEKIERLNINQLCHFSDDNGNSQPFRLNENKIKQIISSADDVGIITPLIVRKISENMYQIISGHHRYEAAKALEMLTVPCVVRDISDEKAFQIVSESNIQRDKMLPTEYGRIFAEYLKKRNDIDLTAKEIADKFGISAKTMYRYINVVKLIPKLQTYADEEKILLAAADIISGFSIGNQESVAEYLERPDSRKITPVIVKQFAKIIDDYGGDDVPAHELANLFRPKPKPRFKNGVYNKLAERFSFESSEQELDELAERLLAEYFQGREGEN